VQLIYQQAFVRQNLGNAAALSLVLLARPSRAAARRLYLSSLAYLALLFLAVAGAADTPAAGRPETPPTPGAATAVAPLAGAVERAWPSRPIANTALQTLHRARTPPSGTLAGSTR
jgi:peptidoglycan/LPS O-acetylase OafA/YrhL